MAKQQDLIDAVNLIGQYVEENLPDGYMISLEFTKYEVAATLENEFGDEVEVYVTGEYGTIVEMCRHAKEVEASNG